MEKKRFSVYVDPDEEAFQRSLIGGDRISRGQAHSAESKHVLSVMDRQTARSKVGMFLEDSARWLGAGGEATSFVPFKAELPTYSDMTPEQRDYYLYWRREFSDGREMMTDEGYILCFAYELINQTLMYGAASGAELLLRLLADCGDRYPATARQLTRWIEDYYSAYLTVEQLYMDLYEADEDIRAMFDCGRFLDRILGQGAMEFEDITALTAFSEKRCLFANNWEQLSQFKDLLPRIFANIDAMMLSKWGKPWIQCIPEYSRRAFPGAVYGGPEELTTRVIDFSPGPQRDMFSDVVRLTELLMGEQVGYGNKKMTANIARLTSRIGDDKIIGIVVAGVEDFYK